MALMQPITCQFLLDSSQQYFCKFHAEHPGVAKVISPGTVYAVSSHDAIGVVEYNATTLTGQSGSPVIDLQSLEVVGIHYCCTGNTDAGTSFPCDTWHPQNLSWNEAIDSSTLATDPVLKDFFEVAGTSPVSATAIPLDFRADNLIAQRTDQSRVQGNLTKSTFRPLH
jgi:hypothetical protein